MDAMKPQFLFRASTQIASGGRTDMGCWSADFANVGPTLAIGRIIIRFCQCWPNGGLPTTILVRCLYILPGLGQCWANGGFLFKMVTTNNRGF